MAPGLTPRKTPGVASRLAPGMALPLAPGMAPCVAPGVSTRKTPGLAPGEGPGVAPGVSHGMGSRMPLRMSPGMSSRMTPPLTPWLVPGHPVRIAQTSANGQVGHCFVHAGMCNASGLREHAAMDFRGQRMPRCELGLSVRNRHRHTDRCPTFCHPRQGAKPRPEGQEHTKRSLPQPGASLPPGLCWIEPGREWRPHWGNASAGKPARQLAPDGQQKG